MSWNLTIHLNRNTRRFPLNLEYFLEDSILSLTCSFSILRAQDMGLPLLSNANSAKGKSVVWRLLTE